MAIQATAKILCICGSTRCCVGPLILTLFAFIALFWVEKPVKSGYHRNNWDSGGRFRRGIYGSRSSKKVSNCTGNEKETRNSLSSDMSLCHVCFLLHSVVTPALKPF